jgi:hypothetical protein
MAIMIALLVFISLSTNIQILIFKFAIFAGNWLAPLSIYATKVIKGGADRPNCQTTQQRDSALNAACPPVGR